MYVYMYISVMKNSEQPVEKWGTIAVSCEVHECIQYADNVYIYVFVPRTEWVKHFFHKKALLLSTMTLTGTLLSWRLQAQQRASPRRRKPSTRPASQVAGCCWRTCTWPRSGWCSWRRSCTTWPHTPPSGCSSPWRSTPRSVCPLPCIHCVQLLLRRTWGFYGVAALSSLKFESADVWRVSKEGNVFFSSVQPYTRA